MTNKVKQTITVQKLTKQEFFIHNAVKDNIHKLNNCRMIIAGSRTIVSEEVIDRIPELCVLYNVKPKTILSGRAKGVDQLGEKWAVKMNIPVEIYPAKWNTFGRAAGHMRNNEMAGLADVLFLVWDGKSPGSKQMKSAALQRNLIVFELIVQVENKTFKLTDDETVKNAIIKRLEIKNGYCPCNPATTDDYLCPCLKMRIDGKCCCGLYKEA